MQVPDSKCRDERSSGRGNRVHTFGTETKSQTFFTTYISDRCLKTGPSLCYLGAYGSTHCCFSGFLAFVAKAIRFFIILERWESWWRSCKIMSHHQTKFSIFAHSCNGWDEVNTMEWMDRNRRWSGWIEMDEMKIDFVLIYIRRIIIFRGVYSAGASGEQLQDIQLLFGVRDQQQALVAVITTSATQYPSRSSSSVIHSSLPAGFSFVIL